MGSSLRHAGSSRYACGLFVAVLGPLSSCGTQAPGHMGSVVGDTWALSLRLMSSVVVAHGLSCGMWDLSSPTRDRTCVPCIGRRILYQWTTREVPSLAFLIVIEPNVPTMG